MIYVTRLNHSSVVLNSDLIEHIEATPDTVITLSTGQNMTVLEPPEDLIEKVRVWRRSLLLPDHLLGKHSNGFDSHPPARIDVDRDVLRPAFSRGK